MGKVDFVANSRRLENAVAMTNSRDGRSITWPTVFGDLVENLAENFQR